MNATPNIRLVALSRDWTPVVNPAAFVHEPWLPFDVDNLYPERVKRLLHSATHNAILHAKAQYAVGDGLSFTADDKARAAFLEAINVDDLMRRSAFDLALFGGFAWRVALTYDGRRVASVAHIDFDKVRVGNPNYAAPQFWYSEDWRYYTQPDYAPAPLAPFDADALPAPAEATQSFLLYYADKSPLIDYYPTPDYLGAMNYIETDIEIGRFHYHNVRNGFVPTGVLAIPDDPAPDEKEALLEKLRTQYAGTANAGNLLVVFGVTTADGHAQLPTFQAIATTNNADIYHVLDALVQQKIITGHRLPSPTLAGLAGQGGLGGNASELATAAELFHNTVIKGYQRPLLHHLKRVLTRNGFATDDVLLATALPVRNTLSDALLAQVLTRDELRAHLGYAPTEAPPLAI